jgi:transposase
MAMGKRKKEQQASLWISTTDLPRSASHPFYQKLNQVLSANGFDTFVEELCRKFYAEELGRPSLAPGVYFRCMLIGYFEGLDSERGIAWRCADSLSLRQFLGITLEESTPDHSTLSRTRRLIDLETHRAVFTWVLKILAGEGLARGKTVGIDATTLEANAAMRSIVRNDSGQKYDEFLGDLARASGIETPTREDLVDIDKSRKNKASNKDWHNPNDPDAKIAKMKDGRTHLAHKQEHAVDMESGAILAVTIQEADEGDTVTWRETVEETWQNLNAVKEDADVAHCVHTNPLEELVQDKGYHSNQTMADYVELGIRSYVSEPRRGRRRWKSKLKSRVKDKGTVKDSVKEREAVYANRRRIRGDRGKRLMRRRGELIERSFAHVLETGGMRRTHLRGHINILKRMLVHVGGFNLGLVMRKLIGVGKPRRLQGLFACIFDALWALWSLLIGLWRRWKRWESENGNSVIPRRAA